MVFQNKRQNNTCAEALKPLSWVCTCVDTFVLTRVNKSAVKNTPASEANEKTKYQSLADRYQFEAAIEKAARTATE